MEIIDQIFSNPIVTGLSTTAALGSIMYYIKDTPKALYRVIRNQLITSFTITNADDNFEWVENWLSKQTYVTRTRSFKISVEESNVRFSMYRGTNILWWNNTFVLVDKDVDTEKKQQDTLKPLETIHLTLLSRNPSKLQNLLVSAFKEQHNYVNTFIYNSWWRRCNPKNIRPLDTIILNDNQLERIISDLDNFNSNKDWYLTTGVPYRRGYLFSGPPGTGKSSLVFALAGYLNKPIYVMNLGSLDDDDDLFKAITDIDDNAIILMEDIDCAIGESRSQKKSGITMAGLLNALDGVLTPDNKIFIMTTNHPEKLDPALIRPGRADVHEVIGLLNKESQIKFAKKFGVDYEPINEYVSPAELQGQLLK